MRKDFRIITIRQVSFGRRLENLKIKRVNPKRNCDKYTGVYVSEIQYKGRWVFVFVFKFKLVDPTLKMSNNL